jgi:Rieske Fe-S protein
VLTASPPTSHSVLQGDATYLIVKKDGGIEDYGINAVCTHLGCVVPWNNVSHATHHPPPAPATPARTTQTEFGAIFGGVLQHRSSGTVSSAAGRSTLR